MCKCRFYQFCLCQEDKQQGRSVVAESANIVWNGNISDIEFSSPKLINDGCQKSALLSQHFGPKHIFNRFLFKIENLLHLFSKIEWENKPPLTELCWDNRKWSSNGKKVLKLNIFKIKCTVFYKRNASTS